MGARPSRRRLPADPPLALDALPPELLVQVLSHVPPRALVLRCRPVCRAWRDVVDGPTVWLLQLARDRSAEGRALYAAAQRCPPHGEDEEEFPLCALARYCLRAPLGRNLIFNSCGERGYRGRGLGGGGARAGSRGAWSRKDAPGKVGGRGPSGAGGETDWVGGAGGCRRWRETKWMGDTQRAEPGGGAAAGMAPCWDSGLGGRG